jgi:hypothetical protein
MIHEPMKLESMFVSICSFLRAASSVAPANVDAAFLVSYSALKKEEKKGANTDFGFRIFKIGEMILLPCTGHWTF